MDARGQLSSEGQARIRNAVLAKAYGDTSILNLSTDFCRGIA
jgi:hypothetical protein